MSRLEWHGAEQVATALAIRTARQDQAAEMALARSLLLVERNTKLELSRSAHARGTPTPSRPGSPPAVITGTLRRSIRTRGPRRVGYRWEGFVGPTAAYGRVHELGGPSGRGLRTHLPPRPYLRPGLATSIPGIRAIFGQAWRL